MFMEVTQEQRKHLLHTHRTADHMFRWVYDTLHSDNITPNTVYRLLIKIHDMQPTRANGLYYTRGYSISSTQKIKEISEVINWLETDESLYSRS